MSLGCMQKIDIASLNKFEYVEDLNLQNVVGNSYIILFTFTDEQGTAATDPWSQQQNTVQ